MKNLKKNPKSKNLKKIRVLINQRGKVKTRVKKRNLLQRKSHLKIMKKAKEKKKKKKRKKNQSQSRYTLYKI